MPHFYFHIRDHDRLMIDEDGLDLPDREAAMREAMAGAMDMVDDAIVTDDQVAHQVIEICDVDGGLVGSIALSEVASPSPGGSPRRRPRRSD